MPKKAKHQDVDTETSNATKEKTSKKSSKKQEKKKGNKVVNYFRDAVAETKRVTYPDRYELVKWSGIVLVTILLFSILIYITDTLIATPLNYAISSIELGDSEFGWLNLVTVIVFFVSGILTMIGVFLHQGEQGGLSDGLSSKLTGGSGVVQKNLDRLTIFFAVIFALTFVICMISFPQGTLATI